MALLVFLLLFKVVVVCSDAETCGPAASKTSCLPLSAVSTGPTVLFRDTTGRLGNHLFVYKMLLSLRAKFGFRTFISERTREGKFRRVGSEQTFDQ